VTRFKRDGIFLSLSVTQACTRFYSLLVFCVAINFVKFHLSSFFAMKISSSELGGNLKATLLVSLSLIIGKLGSCFIG
jgi:hypothetical protein